MVLATVGTRQTRRIPLPREHAADVEIASGTPRSLAESWPMVRGGRPMAACRRALRRCGDGACTTNAAVGWSGLCWFIRLSPPTPLGN